MPDYISQRSQKIDASAIRKIMQLAQNMTDPADFSIGQPDFGAPEAVKAAAIKAIQEGAHTYTVTTGLAELREKIAGRMTKEFGWEQPAVLITAGLSGALQLALMSVIDPGDEVVIPDPYFVSYKHLVNLQGGQCVFVDNYPDFQLDVQQLADKVTDKTKLLILNSPSNPSGAVYSEEQLKAVAEIARKHQLLVISDEIYLEFSYDEPAASIATYYENTIVMRGFSKTYGVPGWRLGYAAMPQSLNAVFDRMATLQQYTFVCAPHPLQLAAMTALDADMSEQIARYRQKRNMIYDGLHEQFGLVRPGGAFYAFVPAPGGDASAFVTEAIKNNVLIIPGAAFSQKNTHFRISYATADDQIEKGVQRLCELAQQYT